MKNNAIFLFFLSAWFSIYKFVCLSILSVYSMVLILDGCSIHYVHMWNKSGISICWRHLVTWFVKFHFFSRKWPILQHTGATCSELPYYFKYHDQGCLIIQNQSAKWLFQTFSLTNLKILKISGRGGMHNLQLFIYPKLTWINLYLIN